jgi:hypothetical protein
MFDPPPCDRCGERSILQIVTVSFEGPSPPDRFLCRAHAPSSVSGGASGDSTTETTEER